MWMLLGFFLIMVQILMPRTWMGGLLYIKRREADIWKSLDYFSKAVQTRLPRVGMSTPSYLASGYGNVDVPRALFEDDMEVDDEDVFSWTPLHLASQEGHLEVARLLIDRGKNPNAKNENQQTPLHAALENGHVGVILLLLDRGANVNAKDTHLWTPLHMASKIGNLTVTLELLDRGAEVDAQDDLFWTPLHIASQEGHLEVVRLLLDRGAHVETLEVDRETALHLAAYYGHLEVTNLLLVRGADVHAKNEDGKEPFELASKEGYHEVAELLLKFEVTHSTASSTASSYNQSASAAVSHPPRSGTRLIFPPDMLVYGYIAYTFSPEDAGIYLTLLFRTQDTVQRISYSQGIWYVLAGNLLLLLDFRVQGEGSVVPQRRWTPADEIDIRRHVAGATLALPIYFIGRNGAIGFWLSDILQGRDLDLYEGDKEAPLAGRATIHLRINVSSRTLMLAAKILIHVLRRLRPHSGLAVAIGGDRYPLEMRLMPGNRLHVLDSCGTSAFRWPCSST
jgi:ankyrin repeat protein